jgi:hypothetical protein
MKSSILAFAAALALLGAASARSAEEAGAEPAVEPEALAILKRATDRLTTAQSFRIRIRTLFDVVQDSGQKLQFGTWDEVTVRRPDRAAATFRRDDGHVRRIQYDGERITMYDERENVYGQFAVPATLDEMLDFLELEVGSPMPLADLLYSDLDHLVDAAVEGGVVGLSRVDDWDCDHLAFRGEAVDFQVWIQRGDDPLLRKVVITYKELPGGPQFGAAFLEWDRSAKSPDELFTFEPPEGAERIPALARPGEAGIGGPR